MKKLYASVWATLALAAFVGCEEAKPTTPAGSTPAPAPAAPPADAKKPEEAKKPEAKPEAKPAEKKAEVAPAKKLTDDQLAEIKKLPEADQKLAIAQMTCPIGEDNLGEMGMPIKIDLNGKPVFLCCAGCEKKAKADPEGTLAKISKK